MTQGGPAATHADSVLYFMYDEGFKWWSLGSASAVAFLLFVLMLAATHAAGALWRRDRRRSSERRASRERCSSTALLTRHRAAAHCLVPLAVDAIGVVHGRRAKPALTRRRCSRAEPTLDNYRELFDAHRHRRLVSSIQSADRARPSRRSRCCFNVTGGLRFRQVALRRARAVVPRRCLAALVIPAQIDDDAAVPDAEMAGPRQRLLPGVIDAVPWPACSASSWCASTRCRPAGRAAGGGPHRRGLASGVFSFLSWCCRCSRRFS